MYIHPPLLSRIEVERGAASFVERALFEYRSRRYDALLGQYQPRVRAARNSISYLNDHHNLHKIKSHSILKRHYQIHVFARQNSFYFPRLVSMAGRTYTHTDTDLFVRSVEFCLPIVDTAFRSVETATRLH